MEGNRRMKNGSLIEKFLNGRSVCFSAFPQTHLFNCKINALCKMNLLFLGGGVLACCS